MPIDFDDLNSADDLNAPKAEQRIGLIVAEKAEPGELEIEHAVYLKQAPFYPEFEEDEIDEEVPGEPPQ
jgi:hypothetical protein